MLYYGANTCDYNKVGRREKREYLRREKREKKESEELVLLFCVR
jgi:hypothetical protein